MAEGGSKVGLLAALGCLSALLCLGCGGVLVGTWYLPLVLDAASTGASSGDWDD